MILTLKLLVQILFHKQNTKQFYLFEVKTERSAVLVYQRGPRKLPPHSTIWGFSEKTAINEEAKSASALILDFPASRTLRNKLLFINHLMFFISFFKINFIFYRIYCGDIG